MYMYQRNMLRPLHFVLVDLMVTITLQHHLKTTVHSVMRREHWHSIQREHLKVNGHVPIADQITVQQMERKKCLEVMFS